MPRACGLRMTTSIGRLSGGRGGPAGLGPDLVSRTTGNDVCGRRGAAPFHRVFIALPHAGEAFQREHLLRRRTDGAFVFLRWRQDGGAGRPPFGWYVET